jgi:hypothetical protein
MAFTTTGKNAMLAEIITLAVKVRLLDDLGAEVVDHDDASQDQSITWDTPASGEVVATNQPAFEVKGGVTVAAHSYRSSDGNTEYARETLEESDQETFANNGNYTVSSATLTLSDSV